MLLRKFRQTGPDVILLIFMVQLIIWIGAFLNPDAPSVQDYQRPMPLFGILLAITGSGKIFGVIIAFLLVILVSFLLVNFNTSVFFISERTFLPALFYILITGLFPDQHVLNPALPAATFLVLGVRRIMDSYKLHGTAFPLFDAGIMIGIGSLFYADLIWFGLLLVVGIAILRTIGIREFVISVLGMATPLFILYGFMYVAGKDMNSLFSDAGYNLFSRNADYKMTGLMVAVSIIAGIIVLISVMHLVSVINNKKIKSRKTFILLFWTFFISAALYFILKPVSIEIIWLTAIPVTYFLSHYFVFTRRKVLPEIMIVVLFILVAAVQIVNLVK
jgi:hypothetical protein